MFYYPQLIANKPLVNIQVIIPGGWGELEISAPGLHFLWEHLLFAPAKDIADLDAWLWEHTLDFWSVTSFESIRLNFTLKQDQVASFVPVLKAILKPRNISTDFITKELHDLKHYWQTDRDTKEDALIRGLFTYETVVHPNVDLINNLTLSDITPVMKLWQQAQPRLLILGEIETENLLALSKLCPTVSPLKPLPEYRSPNQAQNFLSRTRWGLKISLNESHIFELILIELWEQQFKVQFFFEYHHQALFIWTSDVEQPHLLARKINHYELNELDFKQAQQAYCQFLEKMYEANNSKSLEKLVELTEGLHSHRFQAGTYGINPKNLNLTPLVEAIDFEDFATFYKNFVAVIPEI